MKRLLKLFLVGLLALVFTVSLAGCGGDKVAADPPKNEPTAEPEETDVPTVPDTGYVPSPDDPWGDMIISWEGVVNNGNTVQITVDAEKFIEYLKLNYTFDPPGPGNRNYMLGRQLTSNGDKEMLLWSFPGADPDKLGVLIFKPAMSEKHIYRITYVNDDGNTQDAPDQNIYFSVILNRVLTQEEYDTLEREG